MTSGKKTLWGALTLLFLTMGCAGMEKPWDRFKTAELKLVRVEAPEVIQEDLPYEIVVTFESDGAPDIQRACLRWIADEFSSPSPALTCYAYEVSSNQPIGSACTRWLAEGPYADVSPLVCTDVTTVAFGSPNRFVVKMRSQNVKLYYNRLECYAEYSVDGETHTTNRVSTTIRVEK